MAGGQAGLGRGTVPEVPGHGRQIAVRVGHVRRKIDHLVLVGPPRRHGERGRRHAVDGRGMVDQDIEGQVGGLLVGRGGAGAHTAAVIGHHRHIVGACGVVGEGLAQGGGQGRRPDHHGVEGIAIGPGIDQGIGIGIARRGREGHRDPLPGRVRPGREGRRRRQVDHGRPVGQGHGINGDRGRRRSQGTDPVGIHHHHRRRGRPARDRRGRNRGRAGSILHLHQVVAIRIRGRGERHGPIEVARQEGHAVEGVTAIGIGHAEQVGHRHWPFGVASLHVVGLGCGRCKERHGRLVG